MQICLASTHVRFGDLQPNSLVRAAGPTPLICEVLESYLEERNLTPIQLRRNLTVRLVPTRMRGVTSTCEPHRLRRTERLRGLHSLQTLQLAPTYLIPCSADTILRRHRLRRPHCQHRPNFEACVNPPSSSSLVLAALMACADLAARFYIGGCLVSVQTLVQMKTKLWLMEESGK